MEWFDKFIGRLPLIDLVQGHNIDDVYITSDLHLFHKNIISYTGRNFDFSDEGLAMMNECIFSMIDALPEESILWILGDFFFGRKSIRKDIEDAVTRIRGRRTLCLLLGNHDKQVSKEGFPTYIEYYKSLGINQVYNGPHIWQDIIVSHEPVYMRIGSGYRNIHGHTHNRFVTSDYFLGEYNKCYPKKEVKAYDYRNISLDANDFRILTLKDILSETKPFHS